MGGNLIGRAFWIERSGTTVLVLRLDSRDATPKDVETASKRMGISER
jgi:hypothetical protein